MVKWLFKLHLGRTLVSISPFKLPFVKKTNQLTNKNKIINAVTNTFNLEKRNILLVLHKEISELNDQMNIDMVVKML